MFTLLLAVHPMTLEWQALMTWLFTGLGYLWVAWWCLRVAWRCFRGRGRDHART